MKWSKTQVFKIVDNKIENELKNKEELSEKAVQRFYENNLDFLFNLKFEKTEFALDDIKIDTFAIDENNTPVIIEYKKNLSKTMILQVLQYKKTMQKSWAQVFYFFVRKYNQQIANIVKSKIDKGQIRIILIAQEFDKFDKWWKSFINDTDKIELYKFSFFKDTNKDIFIHEKVNQIDQKDYNFYNHNFKKEKTSNYFKVNKQKDLKDVIITKSSNKKMQTDNSYKYKYLIDAKIKEFFHYAEQYARKLTKDFALVKHQTFWYFKSSQRFAEFIFNKHFLTVNLELKDISGSSLKIKDVSNLGKWAFWKCNKFCVSPIFLKLQ